MGNVVLKPTRLSSYKPEPPRRKKRGGKKFFRGIIVTVGAMLLTTIAIKANDTFNVPRDLIGGVGASVPASHCPDDMVYVSDSGGGFCIDRYEASAGKLCPNQVPANQFDTNGNLAQSLCTPVSQKGAAPWVNIPQSQAMELCARVGKHLATNSEWYRAALGTPDDTNKSGSCVLERIGVAQAEQTGIHESCISSAGAYDMVGNVWEWVDATVVDGIYKDRPLPNEGYVVEADTDGVPAETAMTSEIVFHNDFFFIDRVGMKGMFRGGFWNMSEKAGVNAVNAANPPSFVGSAVGFRCAK